MRTIFLYSKIQPDLEHATHDFVGLDNLIHTLILDNVVPGNCYVEDIDAELDVMLQKHVCEYLDEKRHWEYILHNLESSPCVKIGKYTAKLIWLIARDKRHENIILHARLAFPSQDLTICASNKIRYVQTGLLGELIFLP